MSEKVMISVVAGVVLASIISIGNTIYIARTLNTTPSIPDRMLTVETELKFLSSDLGKAFARFDTTLVRVEGKIDSFGREQSKRTSTINRANKHMDNRHIHK